MPTKYQVLLTEADRQTLRDLLSRGSAPTRMLTHARILWTRAMLLVPHLGLFSPAPQPRRPYNREAWLLNEFLQGKMEL